MDPCCCDRDCLIFSDAFVRGDNTNLGSGWSERVGDSEIDDNKLLVPAGGIVMTTARHPTNKHSGVVTVGIVKPVTGDKFRVLIQYNPDDDSYLFAEYEVTDDTIDAGVLRVGTSPDTILHELTAGYNGPLIDTTLEVCRSKTGIYAEVETSVIVWDCQPDPGSHPWRAGLMNNGGDPIYFSGFQWKEHRSTNPDCPQCECECDGFCVGSKTLTLTMFASADCDCMHGQQMTLTWDPSKLPDFAWTGSATWPEYHCEGGAGDVYEFILICEPNAEDWTLEQLQGPICIPINFPSPPTVVQCQPLIVDWVAGTCEESGDPDPFVCSWGVRVTE